MTKRRRQNVQPGCPSGYAAGRATILLIVLLLLLCRATGQEKYVEPVPQALEYLCRCALPDGRLARLYELRKNRPIYFRRDTQGCHQSTYKQQRLATNYAFIVDSRLDAIEAEYRHIRRDTMAGADSGQGTTRASPSTSLEARVAAIIKSIDARGAWVEKGRLKHHKVEPESGIIDSRTFIDNVEALCAFLQVIHER